jgi:hypothetical protein
MTAEEVLELAKDLLRTPGGYDYSNHLWHDRMADRRAKVGDVKRAIRTATSAVLTDNGTWRLLGGKDSDEEDLVPVIEVLHASRMRIVNIL